MGSEVNEVHCNVKSLIMDTQREGISVVKGINAY